MIFRFTADFFASSAERLCGKFKMLSNTKSMKQFHRFLAIE